MQGSILYIVIQAPAAVGVLAEILRIDVSPNDGTLQYAFCAQTGYHAFLGQLEGSFRLRHVLDDVVEGLDGIHHLVVLRGNISAEGIVIFRIAGFVQSCPSRVSQSAALAHFLEDDGIHASAKVFVVELTSQLNSGIILLAPIGHLSHIDLLGIIRCQIYLGIVG